MSRFVPRLAMPLLAGFGMMAGTSLFAQRLNAPPAKARLNPVDSIEYLNIPNSVSNVKSDSTYDVVFTHLHGPEVPQPADAVVAGIIHVLNIEELFKKPHTQNAYHGLGNALNSIERNELREHFETLATAKTDRHNMMICFHGDAYIDSTSFKNKAVVRGQALRDDMKMPSTKILYDAHLMADITIPLMGATDEKDRFDIIWVPCRGGSAARMMGAFPDHSTILVESDAFHDTRDYQYAFVRAFRPGQMWQPIDQHHFLEARLFFQNSMHSDKEHEWNETQLAFFTTNDDAPRPPILIDGDTLSTVRRRAHVLDFAKMAAVVTTDFTDNELHASAARFADIIDTGMLMRDDILLERRTANATYQPPQSTSFDCDLGNITIRKLHQVHSEKDFQNKLNDPERKFARILMLDLYRENKEKLETVEHYITRRHIIPLEPK